MFAMSCCFCQVAFCFLKCCCIHPKPQNRYTHTIRGCNQHLLEKCERVVDFLRPYFIPQVNADRTAYFLLVPCHRPLVHWLELGGEVSCSNIYTAYLVESHVLSWKGLLELLWFAAVDLVLEPKCLYSVSELH